jgi:hypothetical protein
VAYEVNFFADQFLHYFVAARAGLVQALKLARWQAGKNRQIVESE